MATTKKKLTLHSKVKHSDNYLSCSLGQDGIAILNIDSDARFTLDPVGERIWKHSEKSIPVAEIVESLIREYDVSRENCEKDTLALLDMLFEAGLVVAEDSN